MTHLTLKIHGTHCASCQILVERRLIKIAGVATVDCDYSSGKTKVTGHIAADRLTDFQTALQDTKYQVSLWPEQMTVADSKKRGYLIAGAALIIMLAIFLVLKKLNWSPANLDVSNNLTLGAIFLTGLVAAVSTCMATTGGLLLAVTARYNEQHPELTGWQRLRPQLYFNLGRVLSYGLLGAAIGYLGSLLALSPWATGLLTIIASLVMILLGFQLLNLFPRLGKYQPRLPKRLAHKIHDLADSQHPAAPLLLGAGTFFLPCGFTQALQLYVLSQGQALSGGLIMLVFAVGTLPALLSVGLLASYIKGSIQKYFLKTAGAIVLILGLWNINNGLRLIGWQPNLAAWFQTSPTDAQAAQVINGQQVIKMKIVGYNYIPAQLVVEANKPVAWEIDASKAAGCMSSFIVPKLGIREFLPATKTLAFTPTKAGTYNFSCAMGMGTPGAALIVTDSQGAGTPEPGKVPTCDPRYAQCLTT